MYQIEFVEAGAGFYFLFFGTVCLCCSYSKSIGPAYPICYYHKLVWMYGHEHDKEIKMKQ